MEGFKINIDNRVEEELQNELDLLGREVVKSAFFDKKEDGTKEVNMENVNDFLNTIKNQSWSNIKDQKQDRLWMTAVQIKLSSLDYDLGIKGVDGWFWPATKAAVEKFQVANGLNRDGFPGPETIKKLLDQNANKASEVKDSVGEEAEDNKKGNDFKEALKSESILNAIFTNLSPLDQAQFKSWIKPLETDNYTYQVVGGIVMRTNKPNNSVQIKKNEYFQRGERRENIEVKKEKKNPDSAPEKKSESSLIHENIQKILDLNNVYSNLPQWEQISFTTGRKLIETDQYTYGVDFGQLTRKNKPKTRVEILQTEHFKNGRREKVAKKQEVANIKIKPFKIEDFLTLWKEEVDSYNTLQDWQKRQFSLWWIAIETWKYRYKVVSKQLTRETKPSNLIERPQSEMLKNWKRERMT